MNNLSEYEAQLVHPVDDQDIPNNVNQLPKIYRIMFIGYEQVNEKCIRYIATLYHAKATIRVCWSGSNSDLCLKSGELVSIRWNVITLCEEGSIKINRLVSMDQPEPWLNLFHTVPYEWVKDRGLIAQSTKLMDELPRTHRLLFNAIFWGGQRFYRYCTVPTYVEGRYAMGNGILYSTAEVVQARLDNCDTDELVNKGVSLLAGFLLESGKADQYSLTATGDWTLSDRGKLLGHLVTAIEWIAQAKTKYQILIPESQYMALLHCLTAFPKVGDWYGLNNHEAPTTTLQANRSI